MKRVVWIERQGNRSGGWASTPEEIDSAVALIQALISLGAHAVGEALEAEVVALAGAWYRRTGGRPVVSDTGHSQKFSFGSVSLAGKLTAGHEAAKCSERKVFHHLREDQFTGVRRATSRVNPSEGRRIAKLDSNRHQAKSRWMCRISMDY